MTPADAEAIKRYRARKRGEDVPLRKHGPKPGYKQTPEHVANKVAAQRAKRAVTAARDDIARVRVEQSRVEQAWELLRPEWVDYGWLWRTLDLKRSHLDAWVAARKVAVNEAGLYRLDDVLREREALAVAAK